MTPASMKFGKAALVLSAVTMLVAFGGCDRTDNRVEARHAVEATPSAGTQARTEPKDAGAKPAAAAEKPVEAAGEVTPNEAQELRPDDKLIVAKVTTGLAADKSLTALKIKVDARNGVVTLRGPAPTVAARERAEEIARNVQGVTSVRNELNLQAG